MRLGPYEIVAPIGAGGMGEVYRARDTRLDRIVAIKTLHEADARLKIRFEREAKAISALNDPHICALYDVGPDYLVMEHCEGKTLAKRIADGPVPVEQILQHGIQIADALSKAHRQGIIHRDLKPANIMLTKSGVKLLDFGLAKQNLQSSPEQATFQQVTEEGKILGTIQYMAPELLHGKEADTRSDIFALGLVLYEMVTRKAAFSGASKASLISAILEHQIAPTDAPPPLDRLIRACLVKDPDERVQTAHDVALQLRWIAGDVSMPRRAVPRRSAVAWVAAAIALIAAIVVFTIWKVRPAERSTPVVRRFSILIPPSTPLWSVESQMIAVSPDGNQLVYNSRKDGLIKLYLYSLRTSESKAIPGSEGGTDPFFSPDGRWIGFCTRDGELKRVSTAGGTPFTISRNRTVRGATWGPDDTIIFGEREKPLQRVSASGGIPQPVTAPDPQIKVRWPAFLPGGKQILYTVGDLSGEFENAKIAVLDLKSGKSKIVLQGATCAQYFRSGHLVYAHSGNLFTVPFDAKKMEVSGPPAPIVDDLAGPLPSGVALFALSEDGSLFYVPDSGTHEGELGWADRSGRVSSLSAERRIYEESGRLSPDGKQLIIPIGRFPRYDLWRYEEERGSWTRMTSEATNIAPVWSPDGKQIVFTSNRNGAANLFVMPVDGSAPPKQITTGAGGQVAHSWSPDGQAIAFGEMTPTSRAGISLMSVATWKSKPLLLTPFNEDEAVFSPDGRWLAFRSDESGRFEIYVQRYPSGGRKWQISRDGGMEPRWRADGREIFWFKGRRVMAADVRSNEEFIAGRPRMLFESAAGVMPAGDVTPDGQRFLMVRRQERELPDRINVVLGLFGESVRSR
jgi:serine/threonine protein kinase